MDAETVKKVLLNSVQGGDVDESGTLIAKVSMKKLFQQFSNDLQFTKISLDNENIYLYIVTKVQLNPIQLENGVTLDLSQYTGDAIVKIALKRKFLDDLTKIASMPILGVEELNGDVLIKVNTGKKMQQGGAIDF